MRLTERDPVGAGIDSFVKVVDIFDRMENSKMKRELMAQDMADRKLKNEREKQVWDRQNKVWQEEDEKKYGIQHLNNLSSVYQMAMSPNFDPSTLSDDQIGSILHMANEKGLIDKDGKVLPEKLDAIRTLLSLQDPQIETAVKQKSKVSIDLTGNKKLAEAIESVYGNDINEGMDKAGNMAGKKASRVFLDFSGPMPTVSFGLDVNIPKGGAGNLIPLQGYEKDIYSIPEEPNPKGQIERGNIDLSQRKVAINNDGSISTVLSMSIQDQGKEVLIPRVNDAGKIMAPTEAIAEYKKTGKHLGIFEDQNSADQYAEKLHSSKIWQPSIDYYRQGNYQAPMTWGRDGSPDAPIKQIPLPLLGMQLTSLKQLGDWASQLEAKYGSTKFSEKVQGIRKTRAANEAAMKALESSNGDFKTFATELMRNNPEMSIKEAKTWFDAVIKTRPKMESQVGKQMSDRAELVKAYGEDSSEVKAFDKNVTANQPKKTMTSLDAVMQGGTAEKAVEKLEDIKEKAKAKYKTKDENKESVGEENVKDRRLKTAEELGDYYGKGVIKLAQNKIRKDKKLDAEKAVDDAKKEITAAIEEAGTSSKALAALKNMGIDEDSAKDSLILYIKKMKKAK